MLTQWVVEPRRNLYFCFYWARPVGGTREEDSIQEEEEPTRREQCAREAHARESTRTAPGEACVERTETSLGGEASCGIDPSWDHPVFLEDQEVSVSNKKKQTKETIWPC